MNVYTLRLSTHGSGIRFGIAAREEVIAVFASEDLAQAELAERRQQILKEGHLRITEHENGRGFSFGSTLGSMSFIPGTYAFTVDSVVGLDGVSVTRAESEALRAYVMGDHFETKDIDTAVTKFNALLYPPPPKDNPASP